MLSWRYCVEKNLQDPTMQRLTIAFGRFSARAGTKIQTYDRALASFPYSLIFCTQSDTLNAMTSTKRSTQRRTLKIFQKCSFRFQSKALSSRRRSWSLLGPTDANGRPVDYFSTQSRIALNMSLVHYAAQRKSLTAQTKVCYHSHWLHQLHN